MATSGLLPLAGGGGGLAFGLNRCPPHPTATFLSSCSSGVSSLSLSLALGQGGRVSLCYLCGQTFAVTEATQALHLTPTRAFVFT